MPKASKDSASEHETVEGYEGHFEHFDGGWTVEMAIPFKTLRYTSGADQVWGVQFRRSIRRKNEWTYWTPVPQNMQEVKPNVFVSVPHGTSALLPSEICQSTNSRSESSSTQLPEKGVTRAGIDP